MGEGSLGLELDDEQRQRLASVREVLAANGITPRDVASSAYREWVRARVREARACFRLGRAYLAQVENLRCRLAGYAYIHRFEAVLESIERAGYVLQARYPLHDDGRHGVETVGWALWMALIHGWPAHWAPTQKSHVKL